MDPLRCFNNNQAHRLSLVQDFMVQAFNPDIHWAGLPRLAEVIPSLLKLQRFWFVNDRVFSYHSLLTVVK